jgi:pyruvate kinase
MLFLAKQNNDLKTRIENEGIEKIKSAEWIRIDAVNISFPSLSEEEIRCLAISKWLV